MVSNVSRKSTTFEYTLSKIRELNPLRPRLPGNTNALNHRTKKAISMVYAQMNLNVVGSIPRGDKIFKRLFKNSRTYTHIGIGTLFN